MPVTAEIEKWTPEMAAEALKHNEVNRRLRPGVAEAYRIEMDDDLWQMTGEAIKFSAKGKLLDGQHRLTALANSTVKWVVFLVVRGLPEKTQVAMDSGAGRTAADALSFGSPDLKNKTQCASLARWLAVAPVPGPGMLVRLKEKVASPVVVKTYYENPGIDEAVYHARMVAEKLHVSAASIGYCWFQFAKIDEEACHQFFYGMRDLSFYGSEDPRKLVYERLVSLSRDADAKAGNRTSVMIVSLLTRAWNDWRAGNEPKQYKTTRLETLVPPVVPV